MSSIDYFKNAVKAVHKDCVEAVQGLTDEQLHFRPMDKNNHIAFIIWHLIRTEDLVMNLLLQKKPPIWNAEEWDKKLEMESRSQGTGMTAEQAAAVRIKDIKEFIKYMDSASRATEAYLETLKDEQLAEIQDLGALGKRSMYDLLGGLVINHAAGHLGEIAYIKGLQGMPAAH